MGGSAAAVADLGAVFGGGAAAADIGAGALAAGSVDLGTAVVTGGMTAGQALAAGATTADLISAGVSESALLAAGTAPADIIAAGGSVNALAQAGVSAEALSSAGASAAQLAQATPYLEQSASGITQFDIGNVSGITNAASSIGSAATGVGGATASNLAGLLGTAKTGAQLIGGIGQLGQAASLLGGGQTKPGVADPYAQYRSQAAGQLQNLLADPNTITSTPGYQFNLQQGLQAQQAQQAAQGRLVSGGGLLQAQQYGQQYATSSLQQQQNLLATLSGANQAPAGAAQAQQGINFGQFGAGALGLQQLAGGASNVLNPLATLYAQYNNPSPSVS